MTERRFRERDGARRRQSKNSSTILHRQSCIWTDITIYAFRRHKTATDKSLFIVDGAAFGAYIDDLATIITKHMMGVSVYVFAPESFELCILRSRLFHDKCKKQLDETYNYADSKEYGSWEQYYPDLLIELTRNTPAAYTKSNLNEFYLGDNSIKAIKEIYDCIDEGLANMSLF